MIGLIADYVDYVPSMNISSFLLIITFFLVLNYAPPWLKSRKNTDRKDVKDIPGPYALPVLGTNWIFPLGYYSFNQMHHYYEDLHNQYGPIVKEEWLFNQPIIHVREKTDIEKVFNSCGRNPFRPSCEAVAYYRKSRPDRYSTTGITNEQGEVWNHLRLALCQRIMSPHTMTAFVPQVREIVHDWCSLIRHKRDHLNRIVKLEDVAEKLALEITCTLILGRRMGFLSTENESEISHKLGEALSVHFQAVRDTYFGLPLWKIIETDAYKRLVKAEEAIYDLASELIYSADESTRESVVFQSIRNANIDEKEKTVAVIDFISAGIHTLKNSVMFLLYLVGKDKQIQQNILRDTNESYSRACMTEMFRLMPVASVISRVIEKDVELSGYKVNAGSVVVCQTGQACRDERNFQTPDKYLPERWLTESSMSGNVTVVFKPFGIGRRICPGKRLIEYVLPIVLDTTVRNFNLRSKSDLKLQYEFLMTPVGPTTMFFNERD